MIPIYQSAWGIMQKNVRVWSSGKYAWKLGTVTQTASKPIISSMKKVGKTKHTLYTAKLVDKICKMGKKIPVKWMKNVWLYTL